MSVKPTYETIDVQALKVGMVVRMEGGWMSHPFALSRFRISSQAQIDTIRALGLQRVRWEPQQSANVDAPIHGDAKPGALSQAAVAPGTVSAEAEASPQEPGATPLAPKEQQPAQRQAAMRAETLQRQRDALALCEQQFAEAARDCQAITLKVTSQPREAAEQALGLSRALLEKMLVVPEPSIQLLTTLAGDRGTAHALNVSVMSLLLGRRAGLDEAQLRELGVGALLHDIGKLDLPEGVRHHEEHMSIAERRRYEEHVALGIQHARKMGLSAAATTVVAQHHELVDGSGFPMGHPADKLGAAARIVALVNRYDNLCNPRLAARALTPHEALALLFAGGQKRLDADLLNMFIKMMGVYPPGSTVQLTDERFALVTTVNAARPLRPRVLVHDAGVPREEALVLDLESQGAPGIRRSVKPLHMPAQSLAYLAPARRVVYFFEPSLALPEAA
jgi:putative nucleotidyltransferase with HDIG domain